MASKKSRYATERVNEDLVRSEFMCYLWSDIEKFGDLEELAQYIQDNCEREFEPVREEGRLVNDYALLFMETVDWMEIAKEVAARYPRVLRKKRVAK